MKLARSVLKTIQHPNLVLPPENIFSLPEKVLQFGTGVLLRGLPDYFIDKANRQGRFNGRIVIVKSTALGDTSAFTAQDCLYTHCIRGVSGNEQIEENIINSSVSRVLNASTQWQEILACAHNSQMRVVISNTTEVGIQFVKENVLEAVPASFPGKLLAFLFERYRITNGDMKSGLVIIPTELLPENGTKLRSILNDLAGFNNMDGRFINWLNNANHFCNSLVDRIVPGKPDTLVRAGIEERFGYTDDIMIVSEVYRLWAIEGDDNVRSVLSFAESDTGVIIEPDINIYRELKLRMLNGTHTLSCGVAFFCNIRTVREAMEDTAVSGYIKKVMFDEIASAIPYEVDMTAAAEFGNAVLDRFRNPAIEHLWINITVQYSSKMKTRNLPVLKKYVEKNDQVPALFAFGFAAWLLFMKGTQLQDGNYYGQFNGLDYRIQDDKAAQLAYHWETCGLSGIVKAVLGDVSLWDENLLSISGFADSVNQNLEHITKDGIRKRLDQIIGSDN